MDALITNAPSSFLLAFVADHDVTGHGHPFGQLGAAALSSPLLSPAPGLLERGAGGLPVCRAVPRVAPPSAGGRGLARGRWLGAGGDPDGGSQPARHGWQQAQAQGFSLLNSCRALTCYGPASGGTTWRIRPAGNWNYLKAEFHFLSLLYP